MDERAAEQQDIAAVEDPSRGEGDAPPSRQGSGTEGWRRWWALALGSLALSGALAGWVALARVPPFNGWFHDGTLFRRLLVVHVDLALVVWLAAALVALLHRLAPVTARPGARLAELGWTLSVTGVVAMVLGASRGGDPVMANYVPVVDDPLFLGGLGLVALGLLGGLLPALLSPPAPDAGRAAWRLARAGAVTMVAAAAAFGLALRLVPDGLSARAHWEQVMWGGGHLMQGAYLALLIAAWAHLADRLGMASPVRGPLASLLGAWLVLGALGAPLLLSQGTASPLAVDGFSDWMRWALTPMVLVAAWAAWRWRPDAGEHLDATRRTVARRVVRGGAVMLLAGMALGFAISGPNTVVPAHYHASIGAVTLGAMGLGLLVYAEDGLRLGRAVRWQPVLFATGQLVFAAGFALCGADGMPRKTFGAEQQVLTDAQLAGLVTMGVGGLLALAGGLWFLGLGALWARRRASGCAARPVHRPARPLGSPGAVRPAGGRP